MNKRKDKQHSSESYPFIKETIKERPIDKKNLARKFLTAAVSGVIFGGCAAGVAALIYPGMIQSMGYSSQQQTDVTIAPSETDQNEEQIQISEAPKEEQKNTGSEKKNSKETMDMWEEQVRATALVSRKALVRIDALGDAPDLLDDSFMKYGEEEGFVFLKTSEDFYIMICSNAIDDAGSFQVTFSNGDRADAQLCKKDNRTGFYVFRVPFTKVKESTQKDIPEVTFTAEDNLKQMDPVIAIGNPTGDYDSLISGAVTSTAGSMDVADEEFGMVTTDMVGSEDGGGILLNMAGEVVGIIYSNENENNSVIRAVSAAQLCPLLERMANGEEICYIGIQGTTISDEQSENLEIPKGVYIDSVEDYSPAMEAGVLGADIVHSLNGKEITSMDEYSDILQDLTKGSKVKLEVYRKNPYDTYVNVELTVTIKEK